MSLWFKTAASIVPFIFQIIKLRVGFRLKMYLCVLSEKIIFFPCTAYSWLWNPIQQHWGDKRKVDELKDYLRTTIKNHNSASNPMWALMAELTLSSVDVIFGTNNIRKLADRTNRHLTKWFRDEWAKETNIVATDYFLGNDLINVAIEANKFV